MEEDVLKKYITAGKIAKKAMKKGLEMIGDGVKLLDVAGSVEGLISKEGGKPAFPVNISVNEIAAHYSPTAWDDTVFRTGDMVKLDLGVHIDGYIADKASTIVIGGDKDELIKASKEALEEVTSSIKPGIKTNEIGEIVENTIKGYGFKPVVNLTGHKLSQWSLHGGVTIPNIKTRHGDTLHEGDVFAVEPFATDGFGKVADAPEAIIFKYMKNRAVRLRESRIVLNHVKKHYKSLPFAERWLAGVVPRLQLNHALRQLVSAGNFYAYHILKEKEGGLVSQAENTLIITGDGCKVTTV